ncbi:MAG: hypothetical protein JJU13_12500 [Balneolaceae bacterium]|nr:hypothetical protein [Balneolaceae bacterium]
MKIKVGEWKINLRSLIDLKLNKYYVPNLHVHEKLEKPLRFIIWGLTVVGILGSLVVFEEWYWSLAFSIGLTSVTLFFDKSAIQYSTILVTPLPNFDLHSDEWNGMAYMLPTQPQYPPIMGPTFKSKDFALKFYQLLRSWNYDEIDDREDNNIKISIVVENNQGYSIYLYPNPDRKTVINFFEKSKRIQAFEKKCKRQQELVTMVIFCRIFPFGVNSNIRKFVKLYKWGTPFGLSVFLRDEETNEISFIEEVETIRKCHLRYMERKYVPDNSIENMHKPNISR